MAERRSGRPFTPFELAWALGIVAAGVGLRLWHLGTPSLWWDEIVHLATAWQPDLLSVFRHAKLGMPPGFGNAGAMPGDYLFVHSYLSVVPRPAAEHLEVYFRAPACFASALTPLLLWLWTRRAVNRRTALIAATLLALSVPHVLYAAEARSYSLATCLTVVELAAFTRLLEAPSVGRWMGFAAASIVYIFTGLMGILVVAILYGLLAVSLAAAALRQSESWRAVRANAAMLATVGAAVVAMLYAYFFGTHLWVKAHNKTVAGDPVGTTIDALFYYAGYDPVFFALIGLALPILALHAWRSRTPSRTLLFAALLLVLTTVIPGIVVLERQKAYYFHVRHAIFILPVVCVAAAIALDELLRRLPLALTRRRPILMAFALAVALAVTTPTAAAFIATPWPFFARTKAVRDMKGLVQSLRALTAASPPGEKLLLLVEVYGRAYLANPSLTLYLRWYGLEERVVLRGIVDPKLAVPQLAELCADGCRGRNGQSVAAQFHTHDAVTIPIAARQLFGIGRQFGTWPGRLRSVMVLSYSPVPPGAWTTVLWLRLYRGLATWLPRADA